MRSGDRRWTARRRGEYDRTRGATRYLADRLTARRLGIWSDRAGRHIARSRRVRIVWRLLSRLSGRLAARDRSYDQEGLFA